MRLTSLLIYPLRTYRSYTLTYVRRLPRTSNHIHNRYCDRRISTVLHETQVVAGQRPLRRHKVAHMFDVGWEPAEPEDSKVAVGLASIRRPRMPLRLAVQRTLSPTLTLLFPRAAAPAPALPIFPICLSFPIFILIILIVLLWRSSVVLAFCLFFCIRIYAPRFLCVRLVVVDVRYGRGQILRGLNAPPLARASQAVRVRRWGRYCRCWNDGCRQGNRAH